MPADNAPIGFYIKKCDELLTHEINQIHLSQNITRTGWQLLNVMNEKAGISRKDLFAAVQPFAQQQEVESILADFEREKWIEKTEREEYSITEKGRNIFDVCEARQKAFRQKVMWGVSREDYQVTLATLTKMISNMKGKS